jgi:ComF family protein
MGRQYIDRPPPHRLPFVFTRLPSLPPSLPLPTQCAICRGWSARRVCDPCSERFVEAVPRCVRCALRVPAGTRTCGACVIDPPPCDSVLAALDYAHPWDRLIGRFKFDAALDLAGVFADLLERAWRHSGLRTPQLLLPVPLSRPRLRERGYNQSWELARRIGRRLDVPADVRLLLRVRDTAHQLAFPVERRAANVRSAFAVAPRRLAELRGRSITLVDDVMTTGATLAEIARTLRLAGASEVHAFVLARTPAPGD